MIVKPPHWMNTKLRTEVKNGFEKDNGKSKKE